MTDDLWCQDCMTEILAAGKNFIQQMPERKITHFDGKPVCHKHFIEAQTARALEAEKANWL